MKKLLEGPSETSRQAHDEEPIECGQWYWVRGEKEPWLGCVTSIGSNYFRVDSPPDDCGYCYERVHFDRMDEHIVRREYNPDGIIFGQIEKHRQAVDGLLDEIKQLTAKLGLEPAGELGDGTTSTALAMVHSVKNVKAHKNALIEAKEKTLPDLFSRVEEEHKEMAKWMKAKLIPLKAEARVLKKKTESIEDRIFVVELYSGLCEEVTRIREGEPAGNDEKVHLFQRRHYMDEECLANYDAGGMEFKDIRAFDRWLMRKGNRERILPMPKCVVSFQVRRNKMEREAPADFYDFIRILDLEDADKSTFLYMRNGDRYYRMSTAVDFDEQLFPDTDRSILMGGALWIDDRGKNIITVEEHEHRGKEQARRLKEHREAVKAWKKLSKKEKEGTHEPWYHGGIRDRFEPLTPETVLYDDGMKVLANETRKHNRIAVVLQGLLDRSPVFHPHPPWQLWTAEGFTSGIELHHDATRAITVGDPPDFEAYRSFINTAIEVGTHTVGQRHAWERHEARKENDRQRTDWRIRNPIRYDYYAPYGNPGPKSVEKVDSVRGSKCTYRWKRERLVYKPYLENLIPTSFRCPTNLLLNADAYTKGDFRQFYEDPRTRADYLKWAPLLLAAEDFKAGKGKQ